MMSPNYEKHLMKQFLLENSKKEIKHVISMSIKFETVDIGSIGDYYTVEVETNIGIETCYVNHAVFQNYCFNTPSVIWKDPNEAFPLRNEEIIRRLESKQLGNLLSEENKKNNKLKENKK